DIRICCFRVWSFEIVSDFEVRIFLNWRLGGSARSSNPRLSLAEWRALIAQGRRCKIFGPNQLLLALEPLLKKDLDLASAVGTKLDRTDHRGHVGSGHRGANFFVVQRIRALDRVSEDLNASIGRSDERIGWS